MLTQCCSNSKNGRRHFKRSCQQEILGTALTGLADALGNSCAIDTRECLIDATVSALQDGGIGNGQLREWQTRQANVGVDRYRLPLLVSRHPANRHEAGLVQTNCNFCIIKAKPGIWIGDKAYESDELDAALKKNGWRGWRSIS